MLPPHLPARFALILFAAAVATGSSSPSALPEGTSQDWWSRAQRRIADSEYEMTWQERPILAALAPSWHAPNRAQEFRTYFTDGGLWIIPRSEDPPSWQLGLRLSGIGRAAILLLPESAGPTPHDNKITYDRGGSVEWYVNDPRGLKQGFTLAEPPEEHRDWPQGRADAGDEPLAVVLTLEGDLSPLVSDDGQSIDFVTPSGARVLRYADLHVTDATGRALAARMAGWNGEGVRGIRLLIEDRDAAWPLSIDPLLTAPSWIAQGDQAGASFGWSVGTAGDVNGDGYSDVIVGASSFDNGQADEGRAFVYHGSASGPSLAPDWTAEGDQVGAQLGTSVGTAGDVDGDGYSDVIVGAGSFDNGQADEGRAFVYHGSASGLSLAPGWTAESDQPGAVLGWSAGTAGDVNADGYSDVIVGAFSYDNGQPDEGRAFVYHGSASGLSLTPSWTDEADQAGAGFGVAVGTAGDVDGDGYGDVIVGVFSLDAGHVDEGAAVVYHGSAAGLSPTPDWFAESNQASALYGFSAGTAGDIDGDGYADVIVGAQLFDGGLTDEGGAFVYRGSPAGLSPTPDWTASGGQASAWFGRSVATAGDVNGDGYADVIVGAFLYDGGEADEGGVFLYHGSASGLSPTPDETYQSDQVNARFGISVATAGDVNGDGYADVIVGAFLHDDGEADEGGAFVFHGSVSGLSPAPGWTADGNQTGAAFGYSVGTAGDVNGDGHADVIVGAYLFDTGPPDAGRVFVYHGSASGPSPTPSWTASGNQTADWFGFSAATAGDVNGDGFADVIVGQYSFIKGLTDKGTAFVFHGSPSGLSLLPDWTVEGDHAGAAFGLSTSAAGDVNGDGFADVIVGEIGFDNGQTDEGRALVYHGSPSGLSLTPDWAAEGDQATAYFGFSVGAAGDVNADGFADVIAGAPQFDNGEADEGRAFVYHGSASGLSTTSGWTAEGDQAMAFFGDSVATAGDVDGDGFADVIVGALRRDDGQTDEGGAFVYHGSASGLAPSPAWTAAGGQEGSFFGDSVGTAGDVNGDGYADVIVGASGFADGQASEGAAFVFLGAASGLSTTASLTLEGDSAGASLGASAGTAGDVNGDGFADVIVGASNTIGGGSAYVHAGNGWGLDIRPQQRRGDDSAPIAPMGRSESGIFRLAALGRTPFGRGRVKLEWEVKPLGTPLDGSGIQTGEDWIDIGVAGGALSEIVSGLGGGVHHWRLRLLYHPATTPFQARSRWLTVPWNGWQEGDLRTPALADLAVSQTDGADPLFIGSGNLTYTVSVSNSGPDDVPAVLTDTLPSGSTFVSAAPSQGSCAPPAAGSFTCALGIVPSGGGAGIVLTVTPQTPGIYVNSAAVSIGIAGSDPDTSNDASSETTTVLPLAIGDRVWSDADGSGTQGPGEPGSADVLVALYDGDGGLLDAVLTDASGAYVFPDLTLGVTYRLRFWPPAGHILAPQDQGSDDGLDSDADPATQFTPAFSLTSSLDSARWDAGMLPSCLPPDALIDIEVVTLSTDGSDHAILHYQDGNQPGQVTGYNVYRSSDPSLPPSSWQRAACDVADMDEATPGVQWVDMEDAVPPGGFLYYEITAFNSRCPAEGPF